MYDLSDVFNTQFGVAGYKTSHNITLLAATAININNSVSITLSECDQLL